VFAKALLDNGGGHLISIDADPFWAKSTADALPAQLRSCCEIIYGPLIEAEYDGVRAFRHSNVPNVRPNYLYLDGPALTDRVQVAIDVLDMEDRLPPEFFMVVDGRQTNTEFFRQHFKRPYEFIHRAAFNNSVFILLEEGCFFDGPIISD
jgi:hypothetical protein